jgi:segregation and condensation protein A
VGGAAPCADGRRRARARRGRVRGPLDWLLELARREQIDLRRLSLLSLVEAFGRALQAAMSEHTKRADLTRWGEFLAMAAHLTLVRSRLLLPESAEAKAAETEAAALRRQLLEAEAIRRAGAWLNGRLQLGRDVFGRGRGRHESSLSTRSADIVALFRACLVVLRVPEHDQAYAPSRPPLWRVSDAMAQITRLLAERPEGGRSWGGFFRNSTQTGQSTSCDAGLRSAAPSSPAWSCAVPAKFGSRTVRNPGSDPGRATQ